MSSKCLCNLRKGQVFYSCYKVNKHIKLYGAYELKRPRISDTDDSTSSDNESEVEETREVTTPEPLFEINNDYYCAAGSTQDNYDRESTQETDPHSLHSKIGKPLDKLASSFLLTVIILQNTSKTFFSSVKSIVILKTLGTEENVDEYLENPISVVDSEDSSDTSAEESCSSSESDSEDENADVSMVNSHGNLSSVTKAFLSGQIHDIDEAIAERSVLHSSIKCTLMETMIYLFDWFSSHPSLSKEAFSKILQLWHTILPEGNLLPTNYQQAYRIIKPFLVPEIVFHVCVNDCVLFRDDYKDDITCPKCKEPRFRSGNIPRRPFYYLPLGPRLVRSYGVAEIAEMLQSHGREKEGKDVMSDIHDSPKWKSAYKWKPKSAAAATGMFQARIQANVLLLFVSTVPSHHQGLVLSVVSTGTVFLARSSCGPL
ncbi:uncharacterized protein LOC116307318 [Actinia tenebrosa]|uniref:Uncharacterized protein LOC116307318 n=1 Tax=Actinia tenebrosa TaxID=6105 RepID=A0A6P8J0J9_ACTTE|nr:uncharacterized protein LOC116307318 [Actinia tenebrosa]